MPLDKVAEMVIIYIFIITIRCLLNASSGTMARREKKYQDLRLIVTEKAVKLLAYTLFRVLGIILTLEKCLKMVIHFFLRRLLTSACIKQARVVLINLITVKKQVKLITSILFSAIRGCKTK